MAAAQLNLVIEQFNTFRQHLTWNSSVNSVSIPINLTGYIASMQLRTNIEDSLPIISLTNVANSQGQIILGGIAGTIEIYINNITTATMASSGSYDLDLTATNGDVIRLIQGKYKVNLSVTR